METKAKRRSHAKRWWNEQVYTGSDVDELFDEIDTKDTLIAKYEAQIEKYHDWLLTDMIDTKDALIARYEAVAQKAYDILFLEFMSGVALVGCADVMDDLEELLPQLPFLLPKGESE